MTKGFPKSRSLGGKKNEARSFTQPAGSVMGGAKKAYIEVAKNSTIKDFDKFMAELLKRK